MSCFGSNVAPDLLQKCCNSHTMCEWDGTLRNVVSEPIYVQKVFDAVLFNLQGLKTVSNQTFTPAIPRGHRLKRVIDIRCKRSFNPMNVDDPTNLKLDVEATISGADFVQNSCGEPVSVVGADGTFSEKIIYVDTTDCDERGKGTPIFGTQNIKVMGNVIVTMDLLLSDRCDHDVEFTVTGSVPIATDCSPLLLTNFFELCVPSTSNSAFFPRFTEFCNTACETRLATNNLTRDITVAPDGTIRANLMVALCISCEKHFKGYINKLLSLLLLSSFFTCWRKCYGKNNNYCKSKRWGWKDNFNIEYCCWARNGGKTRFSGRFRSSG